MTIVELIILIYTLLIARAAAFIYPWINRPRSMSKTLKWKTRLQDLSSRSSM